MTELPVVAANPSPSSIKKPDWLRVKLPIGENYKHVRHLVDQHKLHTICESGNCPNMGECWGVLEVAGFVRSPPVVLEP
jgi:lipoic acid synthetase